MLRGENLFLEINQVLLKNYNIKQQHRFSAGVGLSRIATVSSRYVSNNRAP